MGRAGAGGGRPSGGARISSGGHSSMRSSGGHSISSRPSVRSTGSSFSSKSKTSAPKVNTTSHKSGGYDSYFSRPKPMSRDEHRDMHTGKMTPPPPIIPTVHRRYDEPKTVIHQTIINNNSDNTTQSKKQYSDSMSSYKPKEYGHGGTDYYSTSSMMGGYSGGDDTMMGGNSHYNSNLSKKRNEERKAKIKTLLIVSGILLTLAIFLSIAKGKGSSYAREKLDLGIAFNNDCVIDEIGWVENETKLESDLKYFWDKTGVQPFIYLKSYDSKLVSEDDKIKWAEDWYEKNIDNEGTFLFVYFAEPNTDEDVGYMSYVNGLQVSAMMDSEAMEIFWNNLDNYWYGDSSTTAMFTSIYKNTADRITSKSKSVADLIFPIVITICVFAVGYTVITIIMAKREAEKEKARETERILNTPFDKL